MRSLLHTIRCITCSYFRKGCYAFVGALPAYNWTKEGSADILHLTCSKESDKDQMTMILFSRDSFNWQIACPKTIEPNSNRQPVANLSQETGCNTTTYQEILTKDMGPESDLLFACSSESNPATEFKAIAILSCNRKSAYHARPAAWR